MGVDVLYINRTVNKTTTYKTATTITTKPHPSFVSVGWFSCTSVLGFRSVDDDCQFVDHSIHGKLAPLVAPTGAVSLPTDKQSHTHIEFVSKQISVTSSIYS